MKIYPETLINLAYCHDWISTQAIAEQRGKLSNGINKSVGCMLSAGLVERRRVQGPKREYSGRNWYFEYRITEAGQKVLHPAMYEPVPETQTAPVINAFHWREFVQPVPMRIGKWECEPRPAQAVNSRFTQYS